MRERGSFVLLPRFATMKFKLSAFCLLATGILNAQTAAYVEAKNAIVAGHWSDALSVTERLLKSNLRDVNALNLKGLALTGRGDLQLADQVFEEALQIAPNFPDARKNLAVNQLALKQPADAEKNFTIALKVTPHDPMLHMYLGEIAFRRKEYRVASDHFETVKAFWDKDARLPVMMAECDFNLGRPSDGLRLLTTVDSTKLNPIWQFHGGMLLANQQEFAAAIPFFEAARVGYPQPYDVLYNLGLCYIETKKSDQAIAVLSELRSGGNKTAELDNLLAEAYESNQQTQQAIELLREATQLAPQDEKNYVDLGMLCADHNAYDLGLEVVQVGLHYLPDSDALLMQRAVIYAMNGRYEDSEKDFLAASHNSAVRDPAYAGLGLTYIQQGDVAQAVTVLRARAKNNSENAAVQYLLGEALIRTGIGPTDPAYAEALAALEKSVRLNPRFVHSRVDLAKLYLMRNKNQEAIAQLRTAIALDPTKVQAFAALGTALRKEGKMEEAAPMFAKVRELNEYKRNHEKHVALVGAGGPTN
jgi:tetratricopeptide (TPR) repeat protein